MASDKFISRGGDKLQAGLEQFQISVWGQVVLDVGSSTGGFVDCLLQNGANKVYSVDTSYGELAWKLRNDSRVIVMERTNILHLDSLPELVDLITIDAGWTKLELVLPKIKSFLKSDGKIIALLKPQYEIAKTELTGGVVPVDKLEGLRDSVVAKIASLGFTVQSQIESPILGGGGNKEFLLLIVRHESD